MSWWILPPVLPGNTQKHKNMIRNCTEMLTEPKNQSEKWSDDSERTQFVSFFPSLALVSRPFVSAVCCCQVCVLLCSVSLPPSWMSPHQPQSCTTCLSPHGGARVMSDQRCCMWGEWCCLCLCSVSHGTPSLSSCLSSVLWYNKFLTTIVFNFKKLLQIISFVFYGFLPPSMFPPLSSSGEMCWNCDSVKMWTQQTLWSFFIVIGSFSFHLIRTCWGKVEFIRCWWYLLCHCVVDIFSSLNISLTFGWIYIKEICPDNYACKPHSLPFMLKPGINRVTLWGTWKLQGTGNSPF